MNTAVLQLLSAATSQLETAERMITMLRDGGPWGLLTLALLAIYWLAKRYIDARDERDKAVSGLNDQLTGLLKECVSTATKQSAAMENMADTLERLERRLDSGNPRQ